MANGNTNPNGSPQQTSRVGYARNDSKDLLYYYSIVLNNWYWIALGLLAGALAFYIHLRYSKTTYSVGGSVLIEDTEQRSVSREAMLELNGLEKEASPIEDTSASSARPS